MFKRLWTQIKRVIGIAPSTPKKDQHQALRDFLDQPWKNPVPGSFQLGNPQGVNPEQMYWNNPVHGPATAQQLVATAQKLLTPRLVVDNKPTEPSLTLPGRKRHLSPLWLLWCKSRFMVSDDKAWEMGAQKMMDYEFHDKMRGNVEILPRSLVDPNMVSIRYNDPLPKELR